MEWLQASGTGKGKAGIYSGLDTAAVWTICQTAEIMLRNFTRADKYISRLQLYGSAGKESMGWRLWCSTGF